MTCLDCVAHPKKLCRVHGMTSNHELPEDDEMRVRDLETNLALMQTELCGMEGWKNALSQVLAEQDQELVKRSSEIEKLRAQVAKLREALRLTPHPVPEDGKDWCTERVPCRRCFALRETEVGS